MRRKSKAIRIEMKWAFLERPLTDEELQTWNGEQQEAITRRMHEKELTDRSSNEQWRNLLHTLNKLGLSKRTGNPGAHPHWNAWIGIVGPADADGWEQELGYACWRYVEADWDEMRPED